MKLWLLRHPRPDVPEGLCYGAMDVPIVHDHLQALLGQLPATLPSSIQIHCSPLSRCQHLRKVSRLRGSGRSRPPLPCAK